MRNTTALVFGCAALTMLIKGVGPLALGGRELPPWFSTVSAFLAPALLSALVVTHALATGPRLTVGPVTAGVAASAAVMWRTRSVTACVVVAAAVTAGLRALS